MTFKQAHKWLFGTALGLSVMLHTVLFSALFIKVPHKKVTAGSHRTIVQAVAVDQSTVDAEVARIEKTEREQKHARAQELTRYRDALAAAKSARVKESRRLKKLASQRRDLEKTVAKNKRIAKQQALASQRKKHELAALKRKQQRLQKVLALKRKKEAKKKLALKKKRIEAQKLKKERAEKARKAAALKKLAAARKKALDTALKKQMQAEQQQVDRLHRAQIAGEIASYKARIVSTISHNWLVPKKADKNRSCKLLIHLGPGGVVLDVSLIQSSGSAVLDRSAKTAVLKASPLPVPSKPELFNQFRELRLTVRPEQVIS